MTTRKWRNELLVNTTQAGNQDQSHVAALADGGFAVAWRDDGLADSIVRWQRYDALGNKVDPERDAAGSFFGDQAAPAVVQLNDGNLWIVQQDFDAIFNRDGDGFVYSLATGAIFDSREAIGSPNDEVAPRVASLGSQGSVAVWVDLTSNAGDIKMHGYNAAGADSFGTSTAGVTVNDASLAGVQQAPDVAASRDNQRFVVVWHDDALNFGDIRARVFAVGGPSTPEFTVNTFTSSSQQAAAVAWLTTTKFVTAWQTFDPISGDGSSTAIKYIIRNLDGTVQGTERLANSATHDTQLNPAICALNDGGFAIAWVDNSLSGPDGDQAIRLQVFDGVGEKRGAEIVVNTTTNSSQLEVSLTTLADGRIVVSWTDFSTFAAGNGTSVRAQIVDPRDGIVDGTPLADKLFGHDIVADIMSGGDGDDTISGLGGSDQLHGAFNNDTLFGGKADDFLYGGEGSDALRGEQGDDELYGEGGNDNLNGGLGADLMDGGAAIDTANYVTAATAITVSLDLTLAATGEAVGDAFISIEGLIGSNFADTLRGDAQANTLQGLGGIDDLRGGGGNDSLLSGLGADTLRGEAGSDKFFYNLTTEGGDSVVDFSNLAGNDDSFQFKRTVFLGGGAQLPAGTLAAASFIARPADNLPQAANDYFIYQSNTRQLWYDPTGNAAAGDQVLIATLQAGAPALANSDIIMF